MDETFDLLDAQQITSVQPAPGSEFPFPGWNLGDLFLGQNTATWTTTSTGSITRIVGGSQVISNWVTFPQNDFYYFTNQLGFFFLKKNQIIKFLAFDQSGTVFGGDLVVASYTSLYLVHSNATYELIYQNNNLNNYESLEIIPLDYERYGPLAGTVLVLQNPYATVSVKK